MSGHGQGIQGTVPGRRGQEGAGRRVIDYLRISITDRCNSRCRYCRPSGGGRRLEGDGPLSLEEIVNFAEAAVDAGVTRVRVTGGEPLVRQDCSLILRGLAAVPGIRDLSLTTNGLLLAGRAAALKTAGLSRINISLDSLDPSRYLEITGATLKPVLAGIEAALAAGFEPVKVNAVALEGIEGDLSSFVDLTMEKPVHVRFIEFMPIGHRLGSGIWKFVSRERLITGLSEFGTLKPVDSPAGAGPARYFRFDGARGTVGFISSMSDHFCDSCNRLRLTADGKLRNCLFSDEEVDVRPLIAGSRAELIAAITDSMNSKRFSRRGVSPGGRTMAQIGG